jgi:hypothetical protein
MARIKRIICKESQWLSYELSSPSQMPLFKMSLLSYTKSIVIFIYAAFPRLVHSFSNSPVALQHAYHPHFRCVLHNHQYLRAVRQVTCSQSTILHSPQVRLHARQLAATHSCGPTLCRLCRFLQFQKFLSFLVVLRRFQIICLSPAGEGPIRWLHAVRP